MPNNTKKTNKNLEFNYLEMLIVTSVYKASYQHILNFANQHNLDLIVYNKNDNLKLGEEIVMKKTPKLTIIDIPNFGRCDYAFIYFILTHYDNLPDRILFTKANYMDQHIELHHAFSNTNFMLLGKHIKYGIFSKDFDKSILLNRGIHSNDIEELTYSKNSNDDPCFQSYRTIDFLNMVYNDTRKPSIDYVMQFGHGPCFCVTRELILNHSKDIYTTLLDTFYPNKGHWTQWNGHSDGETYEHVGKRYHDNLLRFWMVFFVQDYKHENVISDNRNYITFK